MSSRSEGSSLAKPIVGILTNPGNIKRLNRQKYIYKYSLFQKANKNAKTTLYFFCYKDIVPEKKYIFGTYYDEENKKWMKKRFPVPDVLHNRASRSSKNIVNTIKSLHSGKMKVFNSLAGFSKWDVYKRLNKRRKVKQYLPHTKYFHRASDISKEDFKKLIKDHKIIYIKAIKSSRGKKVVRVDKTKVGYRLSYYNNKLTIIDAKKKSELLDLLKEFFGTRSVIAQKGIDLLEIDEQYIDMRAEVQRNGKGKIEVAAIPVRVGQKSSPITTHGSSLTFDEFFKGILSYSEKDVASLRKKIDKMLIDIYTAIEKEYGPFGELGIDIALDKRGNLWYIECNAQSLKKSLLTAYDQATIEKSFLNILEYAKYIYKS